jgi:hypothetical protein
MKHKFHLLGLISIVLLVASFAVPYAAPVTANHSWGNYHWARSSNPVQLDVGDNLTGPWSGHLSVAVSDWNKSNVLDLTIVNGQAKGQCRPTAGQIEVCNDTYGNNGWLGIAQIWASGDHITQGVAKMNDTYFNTPNYNTSAWRQMVMCQEIGHDFGLGHQDENFDDPPMGTCMDYTSDPVPNQHPDQHDYQELEDIYAHLDGGGGGEEPCRGGPKQCGGNNGIPSSDFNSPAEWGQLVHSHGRSAVYVRDFGNTRMITHVTWAN